MSTIGSPDSSPSPLPILAAEWEKGLVVAEGAQGYIHSVETAGAVDGPGLRFVVFTTGCPLQCAYCHNPDSRHMKNGYMATTAELLTEIAQYRDFLTSTNGGVTISGGEPLCQPHFVRALLGGCKAMGLHTAIDTSGYLGEAADDTLLDMADLVLLCVKSFDPQAHVDITGAPLHPTLTFAQRLARRGQDVWLRYVLVPGLTDNWGAIEGLAGYAAKLGNIRRVEILPFHKMGEYKYEELGLPYRLKATPPPPPEDIARARSIFAQYGLDAV